MVNLYNIKQAAYILKVHPLTVRRYIKEGKLKAVKIAGNVRIKEHDLQHFNKEITPGETQQRSPFRIMKKTKDKVFTRDDPFFRLRGRGASIEFTPA